jgi:hypothetical protein
MHCQQYETANNHIVQKILDWIYMQLFSDSNRVICPKAISVYSPSHFDEIYVGTNLNIPVHISDASYNNNNITMDASSIR